MKHGLIWAYQQALLGNKVNWTISSQWYMFYNKEDGRFYYKGDSEPEAKLFLPISAEKNNRVEWKIYGE